MLEDECVALGLESEGVIFDFCWEEGDDVIFLTDAPNCRRLDSVDGLE